MKLPTRLILLFISCYALYGVFLPFASIVLRDQGLSDRQISIALSALGFSALFSPLLISHLADRSFSLRGILISLLLINSALAPFWYFVHSVESTALLTFSYYASIIPVISLLEAYTVNYAKNTRELDPGARHYQSYRVWGSIGFVAPSLIILPLSHWYETNGLTLGILSMLLGFISVYLSIGIPAQSPRALSKTPPSKEALFASLRPPLRGIFGSTIVAGLALSIFYIIFPRYLQELGNSTERIGLIVNIGVAAEIAFMPLTNKLIEIFGVRTLVLLALWALAVRLLLITAWPTTGMIIATQILHAPLVIGLFVSIPLFLGEYARDSFRYSLQSLNTALMIGFSRLVGPWFSAIILDTKTTTAFEGLRLSLEFAAWLGGIAFLILFFSAAQSRPTQIMQETPIA